MFLMPDEMCKKLRESPRKLSMLSQSNLGTVEGGHRGTHRGVKSTADQLVHAPDPMAPRACI